jgi:hypothetical protein
MMQGRVPNLIMERLRKDQGNVAVRVAKTQKVAGAYRGAATFTPSDMLHLISSMERECGGRFGWRQMQMLASVVGKFNTGRRFVEFQHIAASSIKFTLTKRGDEVSERRIGLIFCWAKIYGPGIYHQNFVATDDTNTHTNAVVFFLLWMEALGMISSAVDVWDGKETVAVDETKFETADNLLAALYRARDAHAMKHFGVPCETGTQMEKAYQDWLAQQTSAMLEDLQSSDLDNFYKLAAHERGKHGRQPFLAEFRSDLPTSKAETYHGFQTLFRDTCKRAGYRTSRFCFVGSTGLRKAYTVECTWLSSRPLGLTWPFAH